MPETYSINHALQSEKTVAGAFSMLLYCPLHFKGRTYARYRESNGTIRNWRATAGTTGPGRQTRADTQTGTQRDNCCKKARPATKAGPPRQACCPSPGPTDKTGCEDYFRTGPARRCASHRQYQTGSASKIENSRGSKKDYHRRNDRGTDRSVRLIGLPVVLIAWENQNKDIAEHTKYLFC